MNAHKQFSRSPRNLSALQALLLTFLLVSSTVPANGFSSYEPVFGPSLHCEEDQCVTEAFGVFDHIAVPWLHHQQMGWIYAEPETLGNWFYGVEKGWWFSKADWLP